MISPVQILAVPQVSTSDRDTYLTGINGLIYNITTVQYEMTYDEGESWQITASKEYVDTMVSDLDLNAAYDNGSNINLTENNPVQITGINGVTDPSKVILYTPTNVDTETISQILTTAIDSSSSIVDYSLIETLIDGNTAGAHGARISFSVAHNSSLTEFMRLDGQFGRISIETQVDFNSNPIYNITDLITQDLTINSLTPSSLIATDGSNNLVSASGLALYSGSSTLSLGISTISQPGILAGQKIRLSYLTPSGTPGAIYVNSTSPGTGFSVKSTSITDSSTFYWEIFD